MSGTQPTSESSPGPPDSPVDQLKAVRIGIRPDLEVSRHLFRGDPYYIVRDPVTFQTQKLTPADYDVFVRIDPRRSLGEIFEELIADDCAEEDQQEAFYDFVMMLHRIGFLQLPVSDDKALYRRNRMKVRARLKEKTLGFLFLRIPLVNPDGFLDKTMGYFAWLFTARVVAIWAMLFATAGWVLVRRWTELTEPLQGMLVAQNIVLMWVILIGLKLFHELGHAYCCKYFGGHVPEMGAYLIFFTPCAYVDATASWGFSKKRHRLFVCLAGMYFESMLAIIAVFVWSMTGPGLLHSAAYNAIFLATVVTVLFNINPLMRYDGYYVLSDLVEIPNLRARSSQYVVSRLKRIVFGVNDSKAPGTRREAMILFMYGVAASIYRVCLLLAISAMLASKVFLLGILMAVFYLGSSLFGMLTKLVEYLWHAEETRHARWRGVIISAVAFLFLPGLAFLLPLPDTVRAGAVLLAENEIVAFTREPGFLREVNVRCGDRIEPGSLIAELSSDHLDDFVFSAEAELRASEIRSNAYRVHQPAYLQQEEIQVLLQQQSLKLAHRRKGDLVISAPAEGHVVDCVDHRHVGRFVESGEPIATIVSGRWQLRAILNEEQIAAVNPKVGDPVKFKTAADPGETIEGRIAKIAPAGSRVIELASLAHTAGGEIAIDPGTGAATEPYFELVVDLPAGLDGNGLRYGMTGAVALTATPRPIGVRATHRLVRFLNKLLTG